MTGGEKVVSCHVPTSAFSAQAAGQVPTQSATIAKMVANLRFMTVSPEENGDIASVLGFSRC